MYIIADAAEHYFSKYFVSHLRAAIVHFATDTSCHGLPHPGQLIIRPVFFSFFFFFSILSYYSIALRQDESTW